MTPTVDKLLEDMRHSAANWTRRDLVRLYEGFGFTIRHGGSHDVVTHSKHKQLRTVLPRHNDMLKIYVRTAVKLVDRLKALEKEA